LLKVVLLAYTQQPEEVVARAGRLCYFPDNISKLKKAVNKKKAVEMIARLAESGHFSTFEHAVFTFGIEGISRACSHQLVRHRIASYSQQSQRYVAFGDNFNYIIPPSIAKDKRLKKKFEETVLFVKRFYDELVNSGIHKEDARYILPNASETKIIVTMNARELLHFFTLRLCRRAQWEIREMAKKMLSEVKKVAPNIFCNAGPECIRTRCPEGKMSCGRTMEVKKELLEL
jgi:thymidylate synthase (FAD)